MVQNWPALPFTGVSSTIPSEDQSQLPNAAPTMYMFSGRLGASPLYSPVRVTVSAAGS